jgi:hypothetical protein
MDAEQKKIARESALYVLIFTTLFSVVLILLRYKIKAAQLQIYLFYPVYLFLGIYAVSYNKVTRFQFFKPYKYLALLFIGLSFSSIVISVVFGFHTDVLTYYDYKNSKGNNRYWFDPINIMRFPERYDKSHVQKISSDDLPKDTIANIFLLDNSASIGNNKSVLSELTTAYYRGKATVPDTSKIKSSMQLATIFLVDKICNDKSVNHFFFRTMNGVVDNFSQKNYVSLQGRDKNARSNTLLESIKPNSKLKSNIDSLIFSPGHYTDNLETNDSIDYSSYPKRVFIISDFLKSKDSGNNNFEQQVSEFIKFYKQSINMRISFIRLKGTDGNADDVYEIISKAFDAGKLRNFSATINTDSTNFKELEYQLNTVCYKEWQGKLNFFYETLTDIDNSSIFADLECNTKNVDFRIHDDDDRANTAKCYIDYSDGTKSLFNINQEEPIHLKTGEKFKITIENGNTILNNRCYLEWVDSRTNTRTNYLIRPNPMLPKSNAYSLKIIYTILIGSLSLVFFCLFFSVGFCKKVNGDYQYVKINRMACLVAASLCLLPSAYYLLWLPGKAIKCLTFLILLFANMPLFASGLNKLSNDFQKS